MVFCARLTSIVFRAAMMSVGVACAENSGISDNLVKIGVINDMSGAYAALSGKGAVLAAQMAIDELKSEFPFQVDLVSADHQLKADLGVSKRPEESKADRDYYKIISAIDANDAFRSARDGGCPLAK